LTKAPASLELIPAHGRKKPRPWEEQAMSETATTAPGRDLDRLGDDIRPSKFAHFVVVTDQFDAMVAWYKTVLNLEEVFRNEMMCFLTFDDEHHRLAIARLPGAQPAPPRTRGLAHVAYSFDSLGQLLAHYRRLKREGIVPYWPVNHGMTTSMYYKDPDGTAIEFQVNNFATAEEANAYFRGPHFKANPIGVIFDPDQMVRDYEAGVPEHVITARPDRAEGQSPLSMMRM
jgi:catechol 2,3-dioxygenase-like lactoylglutathione lyase family enzyme